jgi:2-oxoglutarate ferredoxin oxidoreductase subunit gamma
MRFELRITGFGGQGVITAGRIFALAAMKTNPNLNVVYTPSYGFATRGGEALSDVILDEDPINYPKVMKLDVLVALSQSAFNASASIVKDGGLLIYDPDVISDLTKLKRNINVFKARVSKAASQVGSSIFTSTIVLGILTVLLPSKLKEGDVINTLEENLPRKYLDKNLYAFSLGKKIAGGSV